MKVVATVNWFYKKHGWSRCVFIKPETIAIHNNNTVSYTTLAGQAFRFNYNKVIFEMSLLDVTDEQWQACYDADVKRIEQVKSHIIPKLNSDETTM